MSKNTSKKKTPASSPANGGAEKRATGEGDSTRPSRERPQYADRPLPEVAGPERRKGLPGEKKGSPEYGDTEPSDPRRPELEARGEEPQRKAPANSADERPRGKARPS